MGSPIIPRVPRASGPRWGVRPVSSGDRIPTGDRQPGGCCHHPFCSCFCWDITCMVPECYPTVAVLSPPATTLSPQISQKSPIRPYFSCMPLNIFVPPVWLRTGNQLKFVLGLLSPCCHDDSYNHWWWQFPNRQRQNSSRVQLFLMEILF